ncbi:MAG: Maf family protein [Spirochaetia bacterium]|nr:Maf family protein [Spirochaetia bacterium]
MKKELILASTSPRRHQILRRFKIPFTFIRPSADEAKAARELKSKVPEKVACHLAYVKAASVADRVKKGIVLGSDTIVVIGKNRIVGKPASKKHAYEILSALSRDTHRVVTAIAMIDAADGKTLVTYDTSYVTFKHLSPRWIKNYIEENHVMDKAGAYAAQEQKDPFIREIKGSYYNVVGLPVEKLKVLLKDWDRF